MSHGPANPFEPLEPPRGGLAGLRARLERDSARRLRRRRRWALAGATSVPLALLAAVIVFSLQPQRPLPEGFRWARIAAGLDAVPDEPLTLAAGQERIAALRRVPTDSEKVVFYLVGSIQIPER